MLNEDRGARGEKCVCEEDGAGEDSVPSRFGSPNAVRCSGGKTPFSHHTGPTTESAVLFQMLPGAEMVVVDIDAVVALMGVVYCGQDGYGAGGLKPVCRVPGG